MSQLRLFPPPASNRRALPEAVRREARERLADLLVAVALTATEKERTREGESNGNG